MTDNIIYITEQHVKTPLTVSTHLQSVLVKPAYQKAFYHDADMLCFQLHNNSDGFTIDTNYFVGVDWIVPEQAALYIEPKLNDDEQVNFLGMLLQSLEASENLEHLDGLFHVEYNSPWIAIPEQKDHLSPILIVQFLKLLQGIVRKGLKKSYYRVTANLDSRIKGKILVGFMKLFTLPVINTKISRREVFFKIKWKNCYSFYIFILGGIFIIE